MGQIYYVLFCFPFRIIVSDSSFDRHDGHFMYYHTYHLVTAELFVVSRLLATYM
jgi:hypothetical protein